MDLPIADWLLQAQRLAQTGTLPDYIPQLQTVNPQAVAMAIAHRDGSVQVWGESPPRIALMSVMKPFLLLYCLTQWGEEIWTRVGREPSSEPFNSLAQLQRDRGFPRNPMINSGAIALASYLGGNAPDECCDPFSQWSENTRRFFLWFNQVSGKSWGIDQSMLYSVDSLPNKRNKAILTTLSQAGYLNGRYALDTYNQLCCLAGNIAEIAQLGQVLLQSSPNSLMSHCLAVQQIMTTCGLYEASADFQQRVGLPCKSGVSGLILALVPHRNQAIALYSPPLDAQGNSLAGLWLLEQLANWLSSEEDR